MTVAALEQAITFLSRADLISSARQQSLPDGVTEILKISSGDEAELLSAQESSRYSRVDVKHAAQFYVQQILFAPDSDHYRVLGVDPDDPEAKIKLHYRLLVRWLHPDKNSSDWEVVFSDRVNRAWHALRTPDRRREYDVELKSRAAYISILPQPSREVTPARLRQAQNDQRYISSRTIKRLPIAIFGVLGVSAVFALWWVSQLQPKVDAPILASVEPEVSTPGLPVPEVVVERAEPLAAATNLPVETPQLSTDVAPEIPPPNPLVEISRQETKPVEILEPKPVIKQSVVPPPIKKPLPTVVSTTTQPPVVAVAKSPLLKQSAVPPPIKKPLPTVVSTATQSPVVVVAKNPLLKQPLVPPPIKKPLPSVVSTKPEPPALVAAPKRMPENKPSVPKARALPAVAASRTTTAKPIEPKIKTPTQKTADAPLAASIVKSEEPKTARSEPVVADPEVVAVNKYDTEVKKLLQQFSRVYADGNYFALHNLFSKDLKIIGAAPQRKVLHGYRQLFQTSQRREIAIQNVTWLESDEKITVVANYQSQVLPLGGQEAESSRGNIRLVLRMENGELKIIRLQSDAKNG